MCCTVDDVCWVGLVWYTWLMFAGWALDDATRYTWLMFAGWDMDDAALVQHTVAASKQRIKIFSSSKSASPCPTCALFPAKKKHRLAKRMCFFLGVLHSTPTPPLPPLQEQITLFNEEDFTFALGGPEPDNLVDNFQLRGVNLNQLPALEGQGISMALVNLGPCAINLPHVHPRATEVSKSLSRCRTQLLPVFNRAAEMHGVGLAVGKLHFERKLAADVVETPAIHIATLLTGRPGL